ncbi:MAG: hypothetical protein K6T99_09125 [Armatimonadetes bacterium]|nr:hypothetical protein [Armatimonadota bacterium]
MRKFVPSKRNGMTMLEVLIATGLLSAALISTLGLLNTMLSLWMKGSSGTGANMYASLAMRRLVLDIQEGSSAQVVNGNLVVNFPYYSVATGQYIKGLSGVTATYYISGPTGSESSGTYLWKQVGTKKTRLARNVESMVVSVTANKLVRITITGRDQEGGAVSPNLLQQSVKLRNG